jgi:hypothetical protein
MVVKNLLYAIQAYDDMFTMPDGEKKALELFKEQLCLHLANIEAESEWTLYGQASVVHGHHVLATKRHFFGRDANLEYREESDPDVVLYRALSKGKGPQAAAEMMRLSGAGLLFSSDFLPAPERVTHQ